MNTSVPVFNLYMQNQASCRERAGDNVQEINTHPIIAVNMYLYSSLVCHILIDIQF